LGSTARFIIFDFVPGDSSTGWERVKNYKKLDNDLKILQSGVSKLDKDAASLRTAYAKIKNDITQDVSSLQQNMSNVQTLYTTVESDEHSIQNIVAMFSIVLNDGEETEIDCGVPGSCAASFSKSVIFFRIDIKRMSCC
jgi:uncharacterized protein YoxC